jgi:hypothetical protein
MIYEYIFVDIVLPLIIIIKIINFLSETFFPYFCHVHLNILDKVVSSLYTIFGTLCMSIMYFGIRKPVGQIKHVVLFLSIERDLIYQQIQCKNYNDLQNFLYGVKNNNRNVY